MRALLCGVWLALSMPAIGSDIASVERELQSDPKAALAQAQQQLQALPVRDESRPRWLALASEAAYALALPDQALEYAQQGLSRPGLSAELGVRLSIARAQALDLTGQAQESVDTLMTVLATLEQGGFDPQYLVDALTARASAYYSLSNFRASLADLLRVYLVAPEHGPRTVRADVAVALGNVYAAIKDYENAEQYYREAIDYAVANKTWVRASIAEYSLATVYNRAERWDLAGEYFERSRQHSELADDLQGVAYAEYGLARVSEHLGDLDKAERMYRAALPVFVEAGDLMPQANIAHGLAKLAFERGQRAVALVEVERALALAVEVDEFDLRYQLLELRSKIEIANGDAQAAYESLLLSGEAKEEWLEARSSESMAEMRVRFDTERQAQQNALLLKENQLSAARLAEQKQTTRLYTVSVLALLLLIGVFAVLGYRSRQLRQRLAAQALTDELTGVANRRHVMAVLAAEFERSRRYHSPLAVAMFDLDHFKQINDRGGHALGDRVLQAFSSLVTTRLRKTDCFGRLGGEEFIAVLPHTPCNEAQLVMDRLREAIAALRCEGLAEDMQITTSIGIACLREGERDEDALVKRADEAVYRAKEAGRNRVVVD
ncbi:MAG TPA: tetratricopeptide repeat-containing diguanylate cyclase [Arenimonas sp.]|nr:tetratricopeptide repeat-containing diguanylate cyclase [Arenimonas sp.]